MGEASIRDPSGVKDRRGRGRAGMGVKRAGFGLAEMGSDGEEWGGIGLA